MVKHVVFLLEEPSAADFLRVLVSRFVPQDVETHYLVFEGKQDLEKQIVRRIQGWLRPDSKFFVMRDQDSADCIQVKATLVQLCNKAGRPDAIVRVACRELESFFLGDLAAVAQAYDKPGIARGARTAKYRSPDNLGSPSAELKKLIPSYQKREGARKISPLLQLEGNRSISFSAVIGGLKKVFE